MPINRVVFNLRFHPKRVRNSWLLLLSLKDDGLCMVAKGVGVARQGSLRCGALWTTRHRSRLVLINTFRKLLNCF